MLVAGKKMDLILSALWAGESPMKASNGSAFLPFLTVLELLLLQISWFLIRVGETEVTAKLELPQLDLDLVLMHQATAWTAGLMNNGYNFRVKIPLVVSVAEIPLVV